MVESHTTNLTVDRGLVAHATVMTLLGLLSGFTPAFAKSPTAALETHTIGVLQGAMLFGLAAVWPSLGVRMGGEDRWVLRTGGSIRELGRRATRSPVERQGDVHRQRRFNARRSRTVDGSSGGGAVEPVAPRNSHVPAHPVGVAKACHLNTGGCSWPWRQRRFQRRLRCLVTERPDGH